MSESWGRVSPAGLWFWTDFRGSLHFIGRKTVAMNENYLS